MISDLATKLKEALDEAYPHIQRMDEAETKAEAAKSLLDSTKKDLEATKALLVKTAGDLEKVKEQLRAGKISADDAHTRALQEVQKQIADAQGNLKVLEEQVDKKQIEHDGIVASMNSLAKRLNLA